MSTDPAAGESKESVKSISSSLGLIAPCTSKAIDWVLAEPSGLRILYHFYIPLLDEKHFVRPCDTPKNDPKVKEDAVALANHYGPRIWGNEQHRPHLYAPKEGRNDNPKKEYRWEADHEFLRSGLCKLIETRVWKYRKNYREKPDRPYRRLQQYLGCWTLEMSLEEAFEQWSVNKRSCQTELQGPRGKQRRLLSPSNGDDEWSAASGSHVDENGTDWMPQTRSSTLNNGLGCSDNVHVSSSRSKHAVEEVRDDSRPTQTSANLTGPKIEREESNNSLYALTPPRQTTMQSQTTGSATITGSEVMSDDPVAPPVSVAASPTPASQLDVISFDPWLTLGTRHRKLISLDSTMDIQTVFALIHMQARKDSGQRVASLCFSFKGEGEVPIEIDVDDPLAGKAWDAVVHLASAVGVDGVKATLSDRL
ncbi:hypothetical protein PRZ48_015053 [Zasmidium cellare]|uniref:Uncharacterized protein n=1 Tax=Zasmidium cellare TaxID=395010 RepID=A0ABR0DY13_ZASCE|nr:hypothetical protein PRZ48_015053 [Zasmidium cellare]